MSAGQAYSIYVFSDHAHTIYLHVSGKQLSPKLVVYTVTRNSDGTTTFSHQVHKVTGSDGSLVEVDPAEYDPNSGKYSVDYSRDSSQFVRISHNQNGQAITSPNRLVFYYDSQKNDGAPIILRYINEKTGQAEGYTKVINGHLNNKVAVAESDPNGSDSGDLAGENVPAGYDIYTSKLPNNNLDNDNNGHPVYRFSDSPQILNIPVQGEQKNLTYHIHVFKESPDGTIQGSASDVALHITGRVGDTFHISPYGFGTGSDIKSLSDNGKSISGYGIPTGGSGYHATNTDLDKDIQIDTDGQLSPDGNTNYFYRQNY